MNARLIFVEGPTGAGKTTACGHVVRWLESRGEPARHYHELQDDNPIRTRGTDALRRNHPQVKPMPDTGPDGFALDPSVYDVEQWSRLGAACAGGPTTLLDARYMQNSVQPRFLTGAPAEKVYEGFARIAEQVAPFRPLLIYLRPGALERELRQSLDVRPEEWTEWMFETFTRSPFAQQRGLVGFDAVLGFYTAWEEVAERLCTMHPGPLCTVTGAHDGWPAAVQQIHAAVRPGSAT